MAQHRYTLEEKIRHYQAWSISGLTQDKYATQQGINYNTFKTWKASIVKSQQPIESVSVPAIIPLAITPEKNRSPRYHDNSKHNTRELTITLPSGSIIRCDIDLLAEVIKVLEYDNS